MISFNLQRTCLFFLPILVMAAPTGTPFVSDLTFVASSNGWGPVERDQSNGERGALDGNVLRISGSTYSKGLGVHAPSDVRIDLGGACSTFTASIGVDAEAGFSGSVVFQVWADGSKLYDSGVVAGGNSPKAITVSISGRSQLALIVTDGGDGASNDHADWGNARLDCSAGNGSSNPPPGAVILNAGDDIGAIVSQNSAGATFYLKAGVYRLQSIQPKDRDVFTGDAGAVISGARLLTDFTTEGGYWVASGQSQQGPVRGSCSNGDSLCTRPEDLFFDDAVLQRVGSLSQVSSGRWFFDYNQRKIYFADNPNGHKVETSVTQSAFYGSSQSVTIRGLVIEKYANPSSMGAIHAMTDPGPYSSNWVIDRNEIRLNHAAGIRIADKTAVTNNNIHHNGQIGILGGGNGVLIENNEIAFNNIAGYDVGEAGGTKFAGTDNLIVRGNYAHDNKGPGLWTDSYNGNPLFENNHTSRNNVAGIFHELGTAAIIRNNLVEQDGLSTGGSLWYGGGIFVNSSANVEIYNNTVTNCQNGIGGSWANRGNFAQPYDLTGLNVHDNVITQSSGTAAGIVSQNQATFTSMNNRFQNNTYILSDMNGKFYEWSGSRTKSEWQSFGNDTSGTWR